MPSYTRFPIEAGEQPRRCTDEGCRQVIYWAKHPETGKRHPCTVNMEGTRAPTAERAGVGFSHFLDCPAADKFHKRKDAATRAGGAR